MSPRRWALSVAAAVVTLTAVASLAFGPLIRSRAAQRAADAHLALAIGTVRPCWLGFSLLDVHLSSPLMPSVSLRARELRVGVDRSVTVVGGLLSLRGPRDELAAQTSAWRSTLRSEASGSSPSSSRSSPTVALQAIDLEWSDVDGPGSIVRLSGFSMPDVLRATAASAQGMEFDSARGQVRVEHVNLAWAQQDRVVVRLARAKSLRADLRFPPSAQSAATPPAQLAGRSGAPPPPTDSQPAGPAEPAVEAGTPPPSATPLRDRISRLAALAWAPLASDAKVEVEALEVTMHRGDDRVTVGPGRLAAEQSEGRVLIDLAPRVDEGGHGITFKASVPVGAGAVILDVVGGPIALGTLGVREGELGLYRVQDASLEADAHVKLHEDGKTVAVDGTLRLAGVNIRHEKLAAQPVQGLKVAAKGRGRLALDGSFLEVEQGEVDVGHVQVHLRGLVDRTRPKMRVDVHFGIPLVACQAFLDALPETLIPVVHGMRAAGTMSLDGHLRFDEENLSDFLLEYAAGNDCRVTSVPAQVDVRRFRSPFRLTVADEKGASVEIEVGPGSPGWTPLGGVTQFMEAAVMTTEDGRFRGHRGFDHEAIRKSVRENLKAKEFVRGASTISMQLAKNLYLERDKTVSRKLQELILTVYLEQALTKDQLMELYLNVIEFGPMCYGIQCAAAHYFGTAPHALSVSQSMYIASILPNPAHQHFVQGGRVSDGWMRYLYKLMKIAAKLRWITEEELEAGLGEWVVYGQPEPLRQGPSRPEEGPEASGEQGLEDESFGWRDGRSPAY